MVQPTSPRAQEKVLLVSKAIEAHRSQRFDEAERLYSDALRIMPRHPDALRLLGILHIQTGHPQKALPYLTTASEINDKNPEIFNALGLSLAATGDTPKAEHAYRKALEIKSDYVDARINLATLLLTSKRKKEALECYLRAPAYLSDNISLRLGKGRCFYEIGAFTDALREFSAVLRSEPDNLGALNGFAATFWAEGKLDEAQKIFEKIIVLSPRDPAALTSLGELLHAQRKLSQALEAYNAALAIDPAFSVALWRKGFALLALGDYPEGWHLYAAALGQDDLRGPNKLAPKPPWDGQPIQEKHLLIWGEQGQGDVLQFIRYAKLCKQFSARVFIFCQKSLVELLKTSAGVDDAFSEIRDISVFDEHVPIMNLPHIFGTALDTVPSDIPYLTVPKDRVTKWAHLRRDDARLKVGLVWAGGSHKGNIRAELTDRERSLDLVSFTPLLGLGGINFYSLQKDSGSEQIKACGLAEKIIDLMPGVDDFADTAAIIAHLDLIISVDTAVAHLAGALGKPVWILSRYNADWRWLLNQPANPWYPTARIFGQPVMGDWASVIGDVLASLKTEIGSMP